jgi:hypothetical protein
MQEADYCRIPLVRRDDTVRAFAIVDPEDYDTLAGNRWHLSAQGYARRAVPGGRSVVAMHREILGLGRGDPRQGDHMNRDRLDNRRSNLRIATAGQNGQNRAAERGSVSRFRGVSLFKRTGRWHAQTKVHGRRVHIGYFGDEVEAARAVEAYRLKHMPFAQPDPALVEMNQGRAYAA